MADLAAQVVALRREVQDLTARLDEQAAEHGELAELRRLAAGIEPLREQVAEICDLLAEDEGARVTAPCWTALSPEEQAAMLAELSGWVDGVLLGEYRDYCQNFIRPCWPGHPAARWELATLWASWREVYERKSPSLRLARDWHDRWLPGVLTRLNERMRGCTPNDCSWVRRSSYPRV